VQLAQQYPALNVVGMGAQDSLSFANEFVASTGASGPNITMIWDETFATWQALGIRSQPYWILYDDQGNEITSRPGVIDIAAVETVLSGA
jgi:thioredoxin-related protein